MKNFVFLVLMAFGAGAMALDVAPISEAEESDLYYASYNLPASFPPARIESLLQRMTAVTHGVGFRFVGDPNDFDHGHLLYEQRGGKGDARLFPRAILYHTQEHAYSARWRTGVDSRYDYLEVTTRNWIQWLDGDPKLDGVRVINAREYLDVTQKDPAPFFFEGAAPEKGQHYTIHSHNLDRRKLGFALDGSTQFRFEAMDCEGRVSDAYRRGPVRVEVAGESVCLALYTSGGQYVPDSTFRP